MMINMMIPALMQIFLSSPAGNSEEAIRLFRVTYQSKNSTNSAKIEAIHGLSAIPSIGRAKVLGQLLIKAPESHRIEAAKALSKFRGVKGASKIASSALLDRLNSKKLAVQVALIKTLGELRNPYSLKILHNLFNSNELEVSQAAIIATALFQNRNSVQILINALKKSEKNVDEDGLERTKTLNFALNSITGQPLINSNEWSRWWGSMAVRTALR